MTLLGPGILVVAKVEETQGGEQTDPGDALSSL